MYSQKIFHHCTTMKPMLAIHSQNFILPFSLHWCQQDSNPWPLDDGARVLPLVNHYLIQNFISPFFLSLVPAGLKLLTIGWWGESFTTSKPLLAMYSQNIISPLYHYETTAGHVFTKLYFAIFSSMVLAGLKQLTVGWWGDSSATMKPLLDTKLFLPFSLSLCQQDLNCWPLDDGVRVLPLVNHY